MPIFIFNERGERPSDFTPPDASIEATWQTEPVGNTVMVAEEPVVMTTVRDHVFYDKLFTFDAASQRLKSIVSIAGLPLSLYRGVAERTTSEDFLDQISMMTTDPTRATWFWIAKNPFSGGPALRRVMQYLNSIQSGGGAIANYLAGHRNLPMDVRKSLSESQYESAKEAIAEDKKTTSDMLAVMASDESEDVRYSVSKNPNATTDILKNLVSNGGERVLVQVVSRDDVTEDILRSLLYIAKPKVAAGIARSEVATSEMLRELSSQWGLGSKIRHVETIDVLAAIGRNEKTPEDVLRELAREENEYVLVAVAGNPSTPKEVLRKLARSKLPQVKNVATRNPKYVPPPPRKRR